MENHDEHEATDCSAHWAPRVSQNLIRRLYETDAKGIYDEDLIDEVGYGLLARCESFIEANEGRGGRVKCFRCGTIIDNAWATGPATCPKCAWQVEWNDYFPSMKGKQLSGAEPVLAVMREFIGQFSRTRDLREKTFAIDRLIHQFHWYVNTKKNLRSVRPMAANLIEGKVSDIVAFLDKLTYGEASTPGMAEQHDEWRTTLCQYDSPAVSCLSAGQPGGRRTKE